MYTQLIITKCEPSFNVFLSVTQCKDLLCFSYFSYVKNIFAPFKIFCSLENVFFFNLFFPTSFSCSFDCSEKFFEILKCLCLCPSSGSLHYHDLIEPVGVSDCSLLPETRLQVQEGRVISWWTDIVFQSVFQTLYCWGRILRSNGFFIQYFKNSK